MVIVIVMKDSTTMTALGIVDVMGMEYANRVNYCLRVHGVAK